MLPQYYLDIFRKYAASKDEQKRSGKLGTFRFWAPHSDISMWVLTKQLSSIAKPFRDNVATLVLFYTPSAKITKAIFEEYACELSQDEFKQLIARLKELKFTHLVLFLRFPMGIQFFFELKDRKI